MNAGMDGVRLNFSHGDYNFFENVFNAIDQACIKENSPLSVLVDLQGPKIRIGELSQPEILISTGDTIEISIKDFPGKKEKISTSYKQLVDDAQVGDPVLIDDGLIRLRIIERKEDSVVCFIENGGKLKPR